MTLYFDEKNNSFLSAPEIDLRTLEVDFARSRKSILLVIFLVKSHQVQFKVH